MFTRQSKPASLLKETAIGAAICLCAIALLAAISASPKAGEQDIAVPFDQLTWQQFGGGPAEMAPLWENKESGEYAMLLRLPPGWTPGPHSHSAEYHGVTLQGTWIHTFDDGESRTLPPGSYVVQPGAEPHDDLCAGPEECILFIHQHQPFDYTPATLAER